jgi:hypothetical protein
VSDGNARLATIKTHETDVSHFDVITNPYFKLAQDGRKLFFPWGILGRGYVVTSQEEYERMRRRLGAFMTIWVLLVFVVHAWNSDLSLIAFELGVAFYAVWAVCRVRSLHLSDQWLSFPSKLLANSGFFLAFLWLTEFVLLAFFGLYVFILVVKPGTPLIAVPGAALFGLCAFGFARVLMLWRRGIFRRPTGSLNFPS